MSTIDHSNIEEMMFDYHEGNLSESQQKDLLAYIDAHPEYKQDLLLWGNTFVTEPLAAHVEFEQYLSQDKSYAGAFKLGGIFAACILIAGLVYVYLPGKETPNCPEQNQVNTSVENSQEKSHIPAQRTQEKGIGEKESFTKEVFSVKPGNMSGKAESGVKQSDNVIQPEFVPLQPSEETSPLPEIKSVPDTQVPVASIPEIAKVSKDSTEAEVIEKPKVSKKKAIQIRMKNTPIHE